MVCLYKKKIQRIYTVKNVRIKLNIKVYGGICMSVYKN